MLASLSISNFRAFDRLEIRNLRRFNLIGGKNSVGKTCILEACELLLAPEALRPAWQNLRRGIVMRPSVSSREIPGVDAPWSLLFRSGADTTSARLSGTLAGVTIELELSTQFALTESNQMQGLFAGNPSQVFSVQQWNQERRILRLKSSRNGVPVETLVHPVADGTWAWTSNLSPYVPVSSVWPCPLEGGVDPIENQFGAMLTEGREQDLVGCLRVLLPQLRDLIAIPKNNRVSIFAVFEDGTRRPVSVLGDGVVRVLRMLLSGLVQKGGVWLVDEIENGIHYSALGDVWRSIVDIGRKMDKQVICTTHSRELVSAAFEAGGSDVRYFRIDARKDGHHAVDYDDHDAATTLEMGMDFR